MDTPIDRLKHFAATLDMPINKLEKEYGMPRSVGTKIKATSRPLMFKKIRQRFPILNIEWLKTGEGDMLLPEHPAITDGNEINIRGGVAHSAVNNGSGSASYTAKSKSDQNLMRTLIRKVEALSVEIKEKDEQISRLLAIIEGFAGIAGRYKPRAEEERQKKDEREEAMRRRRAEAKAAKKRRSEISRFQRVCNPRMIIYTCERFSAKIERSMDATAVCLNIYSNHKNKQTMKKSILVLILALMSCVSAYAIEIDEIDMRDTIRRDGFTKELYMRVIKEKNRSTIHYSAPLIWAIMIYDEKKGLNTLSRHTRFSATFDRKNRVFETKFFEFLSLILLFN